ncbi:AMP-binding-domain-containing protein, partial [Lindgomyces ingoldianus]
CRAQQVTPFVVLLSAFRAAHYRLTGVDDATIGIPIANRNRAELEHLIGFFVNTQGIRVSINDDTFDSLVQQVRETTTGAFANQDVPFEQLVSSLLPGSRDTSRNPLVQLMFAVHSQKHLGRLNLEGVEGELIPLTPTTRFDMEFHFFQEESSMTGGVLYGKDLFEAETVIGVLSVFYEILRRGLNEPKTPITTLPITDGLSELRDLGLLDIQRREYPRDSTVVDLFRDQVAISPEALAVKDSAIELTYVELDRQSDKLAAYLRTLRVPSGTLIAVLGRRSWQTVVAFFGILKANLAYLPLDVSIPQGRLEAIFSTISGHRIVLLGTGSEAMSGLDDIDFIPISEALSASVQKNTRKAIETVMPTATSLAYVIFTSGSTGTPKGIMIPHRSLVNVLSQRPAYGAVAHMTSLAFDPSVFEMLTALLHGHPLVCIDTMTALEGTGLVSIFKEQQIRVAFMTPALLSRLLTQASEALGELDALYVLGDRFPAKDAHLAAKLVKSAVINIYGPSENSICTTLYSFSSGVECHKDVPIGRSIKNSGVFLMDPRGQLVSPGVLGEVVVTGDQLSLGYTDSRLNNRFVEITVAGKTMRAFKTGDAARCRPKDMQLEFLGRMDQQVKIRGQRVELAEIEHALLRHDS